MNFSFVVDDYDLGATLNSGQAFRWMPRAGGWDGVIGRRWVHLREAGHSRLQAQAAEPQADWTWLTNYLRTADPLRAMLQTFPPDPALHEAVLACHGLRLLRQDPWECLASFILSSTKQIAQIRQIIALLCARYGEQIPTPAEALPAWAFPEAERLARLTESDLRACKMGFRAPYLLETARQVASGRLALAELEGLPLTEARRRLMDLPGVGRKIADCVLLFACGHGRAYPVDVWVFRALQEIYFPRRRPSLARLLQFTETHFGPHAGLAQQYLFHYRRTRSS